MSDSLGFLLDVLASRPTLTTPGCAPDPDTLTAMARRRSVTLPGFDRVGVEELEWLTAIDCMAALRSDLWDALVPDDSAGREVLNRVLADWHTHFALEEEVGPRELPGVELTVGTLPPVDLRPAYAYRGGPGLPTDTAEKCPHLAGLLRSVASVLLTGAANVHLSGYADRVHACAAPDCLRPFIDRSDTSRRRYCSPRCRAREGARRAALAAWAGPRD